MKNNKIYGLLIAFLLVFQLSCEKSDDSDPGSQALELPPFETMAFDFEDFTALTDAFSRILKELKSQNITASEVQIDLTGGQKPTSVAAAAVTPCSARACSAAR